MICVVLIKNEPMIFVLRLWQTLNRSIFKKKLLGICLFRIYNYVVFSGRPVVSYEISRLYVLLQILDFVIKYYIILRHRIL